MEIKASVTVKYELGELPKYYKSQRPKGGGFSEVKKLIEIIMSPLILYKYKISQIRKVMSMKNTKRLYKLHWMIKVSENNNTARSSWISQITKSLYGFIQ